MLKENVRGSRQKIRRKSSGDKILSESCTNLIWEGKTKMIRLHKGVHLGWVQERDV